MEKRYKMKMRGMVLYLLIALVPTVILFSFYIHVLTTQMKQEVIHTMLQALRQSALRVENDLEDLKSVSNYLFSSSTLNRALAANPAMQKMEDQLEEMDSINNILQAAKESTNLDSIRVYVPDEKMYARERQEIFPYSDFISDPIFSNVSAKGEYLLLTLNSLGETGEKDYISYVRLVKDMNHIGCTIGALAVNFDSEWVKGALDQLDFPENALVCLTDSNGRVLLGDQEKGSVAAPWKNEDFRPGSEMAFRSNGRDYLIQQIELSGWYLVAELPEDGFFGDGRSNWIHLVLYVILLMAFIGLMMVAFSLIINGVAHRIQQLALVFEGMGESKTPEKVEKQPSHSFFRIFRSLDESLENAIADYNAVFHTNFDTSADKFQNYYKDLSARVKNREVDLLIVVNMFLTGFDATTLNTLWVDKNLKMHGLIQAYSRTNRILNSVKTFGNIICFRDLQQETNNAIALFGDENASGIVLLRSFHDYYAGYKDDKGRYHPGYKDLLEKLQLEFPLGIEISGEQAEKDFIRLFGNILSLQNILSSFDQFKKVQSITERKMQDYQSVYIDFYNKYRVQSNGDKENINDDIVFEIELVKQVEVNIDYILMLVEKYHKGNCEDKEILATIRKSVDASIQLRSKKELIDQFISRVNIESSVQNDWRKYVSEQEKSDLQLIISEEKLNSAETCKFMENAFRDGTVKTTGTDIDRLLPPVSRFGGGNRAQKKKHVIDELKSFFEKYFGLGIASFNEQ